MIHSLYDLDLERTGCRRCGRIAVGDGSATACSMRPVGADRCEGSVEARAFRHTDGEFRCHAIEMGGDLGAGHLFGVGAVWPGVALHGDVHRMESVAITRKRR